MRREEGKRGQGYPQEGGGRRRFGEEKGQKEKILDKEEGRVDGRRRGNRGRRGAEMGVTGLRGDKNKDSHLGGEVY